MWITYEKRRTGRKEISIQRSGVIHIPHWLHTAIGSPERVQLCWHPTRKAIGLLPSTERAVSYRVSKTSSKHSSGVQVTADRFIKHYQIPHDKLRHFPATIEDNMIVAEIGAAWEKSSTAKGK